MKSFQKEQNSTNLLLKMAFFQKIPKKYIPKTIMNLKFKFPTNNSKVWLILIDKYLLAIPFILFIKGRYQKNSWFQLQTYSFDKGQISKQNCRAITSPKKQTNISFFYPDDSEIFKTWNRNSSLKYLQVDRIEKQIRSFVFWEKLWLDNFVSRFTKLYPRLKLLNWVHVIWHKWPHQFLLSPRASIVKKRIPPTNVSLCGISAYCNTVEVATAKVIFAKHDWTCSVN